MDQNLQRVGFINWLLLLVGAVVTGATSLSAGTQTGRAGAVFLALGFLVALVSYFQMRLRTREQLERLEFDELMKSKGGSTLFGEGAGETFPAQHSREQFDRWMVPIFTVFLFLLQAGSGFVLWTKITTDAPPIGKSSFAMAIFGMLALGLFLFGRYSANLARFGGTLLLRPGAGYLLLGAAISLSGALVEAAVWFRAPVVDLYGARVLSVILGLAAVETAIGLLLELYRPRVRGQQARLLYESRLVGLLGQPAGLFKTAAQALDYQFGFKVSETWFYLFLEKALAWIVLLQLGVLGLSTTVVVVEPHEQALLERFGKRVSGRNLLEPGLHFKFPWPIDQVHRWPTASIRHFNVGFVPDPLMEKEKTLSWTRSHNKEEVPFLVASRSQIDQAGQLGADQAVPVNLLTASIPVQYIVTNYYAWAYNHSNPSNLLERIATREIVNYFLSVDMDEIMSVGRITAAKELQARIQKKASESENLGVEILLVGLQDIHPPVGNKQVQVAAAFEAVIGAIQEKEAKILAAEGYRLATVPKAHAEAARLLSEAAGYRVQKIAAATAQAARFTNQLAAYEASPSVFMQRTYLESLARAVVAPRKYLLMATNTEDIIMMNLEDKLRPDLLDVPVALPPSKK